METTKKPATETINNVSCDDGNHKKANDGNHQKMLDDVDDGNHKKRPDGFRDELSIFIYKLSIITCIYIYIYI